MHHLRTYLELVTLKIYNNLRTTGFYQKFAAEVRIKRMYWSTLIFL